MEARTLRDARAKLRETQEAARAHDRDCGTCDVRRRVRCDEGHALVRAIWAADNAVREAFAASHQQAPDQGALDLGLPDDAEKAVREQLGAQSETSTEEEP